MVYLKHLPLPKIHTYASVISLNILKGKALKLIADTQNIKSLAFNNFMKIVHSVWYHWL